MRVLILSLFLVVFNFPLVSKALENCAAQKKYNAESGEFDFCSIYLNGKRFIKKSTEGMTEEKCADYCFIGDESPGIVKVYNKSSQEDNRTLDVSDKGCIGGTLEWDEDGNYKSCKLLQRGRIVHKLISRTECENFCGKKRGELKSGVYKDSESYR